VTVTLVAENKGGDVPKDSARLSVQLIGQRPHLTAMPRPKVACCKKCRRAPLYNPTPDLEPAPSFAEAIDTAIRWNV
jgi:hypothetical protein